jgi:hypothetical protein
VHGGVPYLIHTWQCVMWRCGTDRFTEPPLSAPTMFQRRGCSSYSIRLKRYWEAYFLIRAVVESAGDPATPF